MWTCKPCFYIETTIWILKHSHCRAWKTRRRFFTIQADEVRPTGPPTVKEALLTPRPPSATGTPEVRGLMFERIPLPMNNPSWVEVVWICNSLHPKFSDFPLKLVVLKMNCWLFIQVLTKAAYSGRLHKVPSMASYPSSEESKFRVSGRGLLNMIVQMLDEFMTSDDIIICIHIIIYVLYIYIILCILEGGLWLISIWRVCPKEAKQ